MRQTKMANWDIYRKWFIIDATDLVAGRFSTEVATILMGKNKPQYTPHLDLGDNVIVINAEKIKFTGNKLDKKFYYNHSGYPGGMRVRSTRTMLEKYPVELIERIVKGMLPKNRLGRQMIKKLFVYKGEEHKHEAQKPIPFVIKTRY